MTGKSPEATEADVGTENLESTFRRPEPLAKEVEGMSDSPRRQKLIKAISYFTNASRSGAVRYQQLPSSISIFEAARNLPVGIASQVSRNDKGQAVWLLRVRGADVPGRFTIVDGVFVSEPPEAAREGSNKSDVGHGCAADAVYFTNIISKGAVLHNRSRFAIEVKRSPDDSTPIGLAFQVAQNTEGLALWRLRVHGIDLSGRFIVVEGGFVLEVPD
jgi:hypothetical protein